MKYRALLLLVKGALLPVVDAGQGVEAQPWQTAIPLLEMDLEVVPILE